MALPTPLDTVVGLDQKQYVRVVLEDGATLDGRVSQLEYDLEERVRLELEVRDGDGRYQLRATCADGEWAPPVVRIARSDAGTASGGEWELLGRVERVVPLGRSQFGDPVDEVD